jgi:hypothetical protein
VVFHKDLDAVVIQPDGVEDAGGGFHNPGWRISLTRIASDSLWNEGPQAAKIQTLRKFPPISKSAGGYHHRVGKVKTAQLNSKIHLRKRTSRILRSHTSFAACYQRGSFLFLKE